MNRLLRALAAAGVVAAVSLLGAPLQAHHSIDFDTHDCSGPEATPDVEPDLTPPPTQPPAGGGEGPPVEDEPTPAPQNCMPPEGDRIWGTRIIKFSTETDGARPLRRIALYILSQEETIPSPNEGQPLVEEVYSRQQDIDSYEVPFSWDSRELTPLNGKYKIRVEAETYQPFSSEVHKAARERLNLNVDNAPLSVAAPEVVATTLSSATITWPTAVEMDKLSYTIYRADTKDSKRPPYSAFKAIGVSQGEGFRDATVKPGYHWYAVKVTRRSVVTPDTGISSALSPMSAAAHVRTPVEEKEEDEKNGKDFRRKIPFRDLSPPKPSSRLAGVADAPFAYKLPYDDDEAVPEAFGEGSSSEGGSDPRGPVLPVAVGMFLVSSALAVGRMPY